VLSYRWVKAIYDRQLKDCANFDFRLVPDLAHSVTVDQLQEATQWMLAQLEKRGIKP
jgi:acetyl esterase/lipase